MSTFISPEKLERQGSKDRTETKVSTVVIRQNSKESPDGLRRTDSKNYKPALTSTEVFISKLELAYFTHIGNSGSERVNTSYEWLAARVKLFGYGGITQLNQTHLKRLFEGHEQIEAYLKLVRGHSTRSV